MGNGTYDYDNPLDCETAGEHLKDVDDDGYCNACGYQETGREFQQPEREIDVEYERDKAAEDKYDAMKSGDY